MFSPRTSTLVAEEPATRRPGTCVGARVRVLSAGSVERSTRLIGVKGSGRTRTRTSGLMRKSARGRSHPRNPRSAEIASDTTNHHRDRRPGSASTCPERSRKRVQSSVASFPARGARFLRTTRPRVRVVRTHERFIDARARWGGRRDARGRNRASRPRHREAGDGARVGAVEPCREPRGASPSRGALPAVAGARRARPRRASRSAPWTGGGARGAPPRAPRRAKWSSSRGRSGKIR